MSLVSYAGRDPAERRHYHAKRKPRLMDQMKALFRSGLDTAQIAARVGLTEAQVYNRLARARAGE